MFDVNHITQNAHALSNQELFSLLNTSLSGLSKAEVEKRKEHYSNNIFKIQPISPISLFLKQFNKMTALLFIAAFLAFLFNHFFDALGIIIAAFLAMFFGFLQEYKAEEKLNLLYDLSVPKSKVIRENKLELINSNEIVIGDIIVLNEGDIIPADCKIIKGERILSNQAILSGESYPAEKSAKEKIPLNVALVERENMLYAGCYLIKGNATCLVVGPGKYSEFGKIANLIGSITKESNLSKNIEELANFLVRLALFFLFFFFVLGLWFGLDLKDLVLGTILLFVAAVPEGLPTVLTITLAFGVERMAKSNAIVRKLGAIESIGRINIICTDKTGTLTKNELKLIEIYSCMTAYTDLKKIKLNPKIKKILEIGILASPDSLAKKEESKSSGSDPLEEAILDFALKKGIQPNLIYSKNPTLSEFPFDPKHKLSFFVRKNISTNSNYIFLKGSPEEVLKRSAFYLDSNLKEKKLSKEKILELGQIIRHYSIQAIRVVGLAYKKTNLKSCEVDKIDNLVFVGFLGFFDEPVEGVSHTIQLAKESNLQIIMLTGDLPYTAKAVAYKIGLIDDLEMEVPLGSDLEKLDDKQICSLLLKSKICARATPEDKFKIVSAFQKNGYIVGLTGDGANDAPALKQADVGIAMGIGGTDIARSVSDIILTDNNLRTIIKAIEYSRSVFENIKSFLSFQLTTNISLLFLSFIFELLNGGLIFKPLQILWINLIMDGPPALALGIQKRGEEILKKPSKYFSKKNLVDKKVIFNILISSLFMIVSSLVLFFFYKESSPQKLVTLIFNIFVLLQILNAFVVSSESSFFSNLFKNKYLLLATLLVVLIHLLIMFYAEIAKHFYITMLDLNDWLISLAICFAFIIYSDLSKFLFKSIYKEEFNSNPAS